MRDTLTIFAALAILVLTAALVAPPLVNWEAHRALIDDVISSATGTEARTEGRIGVRLLPSPRLRVDRLRLGPQRPDAFSLNADFVWSEIELTPLLRGDVRFLDTRIGRAEVRVPVEGDGRWRLPLDADESDRSGLAIENLTVAELLVTTQVPATGRTDQFYAEGVTLEARSLFGPWRAEGTARGVPFRLVTGELGADRTAALKITGGGDAAPRFDIDGRLALEPGPDGTTAPTLSGRARIALGPPAQAANGLPVPVTVEAGFKSSGSTVELDPITIESGEGSASLRLAGTGTVSLDSRRVALKLDGRRLDVDSVAASEGWRDFFAGLRGDGWPEGDVPVELDLTLASLGLVQEDLTSVAFKGVLERGTVAVERLSFVAPGDTRVLASGTAGVTDEAWSGQVAVTSAAPERTARFLEKLGLRNPFLRVLDGRPFEGAAEITVAQPVTSFRKVRLKAGDATLTGNARYTAPDPGGRGRLEAQVAVQGLDLDRLPQVSSLFHATQNLDVGFTLDAKDVSAGNRRGAGRISAKIVSDGPTLVVETLDIADLAGANAKVNGRIAPDGSGRIAGTVTAPRAAPLVDLIGSVWVGGVAKLVPPFLREGALDLDVVTERAPPEPGGPALRLRTTVRGRAAGGAFESEVLTVDGLTQSLQVKLGTDNTGRWIGRREAPSLRRPSQMSLSGSRERTGRFVLTGAGDIAGIRVATTEPFVLSLDDDSIESGAAEVAGADLGPFAMLVGTQAAVRGSVPVQARVAFSREAGVPQLALDGRLANEAVVARLAMPSLSDVSGTVEVDRLSLPWLLSTFALNAGTEGAPSTPWPAGRFGEPPRIVTAGRTAFRVGRLELGRSLVANDAAFGLDANPDGLAIRDFGAKLADGRLAGSLAVTRQGTSASVVAEGMLRDVPLDTLSGPTPFQARISATLRVGATGESPAALVANLGGSGDARLSDVAAPGGDPAAVSRALQRLLAEEDPLAVRRTEIVMAEELARGPLTAPAISAALSVIGGVVRVAPVAIETPAASWLGSVAYDLKSLVLDARGSLVSKATPPRNWTGSAPSVGLAWRGPLSGPAREIDPAPFANGLAAVVLQRELEKIEMFESDANEVRRRQQHRDMDRQRERDRIAAEEAARLARLREEAEQRARAEAERVRLEAERRAVEEAARVARLREEAEQRARVEAERLRLEAERRAAQERAAQERAIQERAARERALQERAAQERAAQERAAQERAAQEKAAQERAAAEQQEDRPPPFAPAGASALPALPPPMEIRPPPQIGVRPGG